MSNYSEIIKQSEISKNNKLPLISIIIPTYNREFLVEKAIKSAISQTYPNFEVVIIDNASLDKTIEKTLNLVKDNPRVSVIRNTKNIGPVLNWLAGVNLSNGEYSKILFSDDFLYPDCLSKFYELFDSEVGLVCSSCHIGENPKEATIMCKFPKNQRKIKSKRLIYKYLITRSFLNSPCAAMFRKEDLMKSLINSIDNPISKESLETGAGPDVKIYLDILQKYPYFGYSREPKVFFRVHKGSFTIGKYKNIVSECYQMTFEKFINESSKSIKLISKFHYIYKLCSYLYRFLENKFKRSNFLNLGS